MTAIRKLLVASAATWILSCGGTTVDHPGSSNSGGTSNDSGAAGTGGATPSAGGSGGGSGGSHPSTGGTRSTGGTAAAVPDCKNPVANGTPCTEPMAVCGGPCSNSWQARNLCMGGYWQPADVVPCGPDASHAPQCRNSFSGGSLTPCCPSGSLDCAGKPDGYPGFGCTPGNGSFCSCSCSMGMQVCGC
jgi:hypothetical protein